MDGKCIAELFDAYPSTENFPAREFGMNVNGEQLIQHGSKYHGLDMMVAAHVFESTAQLAALLEGAELDFNAPSQGIDVADFLCFEDVRIDVGDEDTPICTKQGLPVGGNSAALRLGFDVAAVCRCTLRVESDRYESAAYAFATHLC